MIEDPAANHDSFSLKFHFSLTGPQWKLVEQMAGILEDPASG